MIADALDLLEAEAVISIASCGDKSFIIVTSEHRVLVIKRIQDGWETTVLYPSYNNNKM